MKAIVKVIVGVFSAGLAGCSYMESMFPDKERDYQYTSEIPMINLPSELRRNRPSGDIDYSSASPGAERGIGLNGNSNGGQDAASPSADPGAPPASPSESEEISDPNTETSSTEVVSADDSDVRDTVTAVAVVKYDDGESRLRLGAGQARAWRVVNKALSRNTIEVTERNYDKSYLKVQYDPDEKKAKDEGFMDEINFIFNGIGVDDKKFVLKLEDHGEETDVIVLDDDFLPVLNEQKAVSLLKVMADTIKADLAKKARAEQQGQQQEQPAESNPGEVKSEGSKPEETKTVETESGVQKSETAKTEGLKSEEQPPAVSKPEDLKLKALNQLIPPVETPKEP